MSDSPPIAVTRKFDPYDHGSVQKFLRILHTEFGPAGDDKRWTWVGDTTGVLVSWTVILYFKDSRDAIICALKYSS